MRLDSYLAHPPSLPYQRGNKSRKLASLQTQEGTVSEAARSAGGNNDSGERFEEKNSSIQDSKNLDCHKFIIISPAMNRLVAVQQFL
jgi:hypothetical protein